jgi:hypothetical protein
MISVILLNVFFTGESVTGVFRLVSAVGVVDECPGRLVWGCLEKSFFRGLVVLCDADESLLKSGDLLYLFLRRSRMRCSVVGDIAYSSWSVDDVDDDGVGLGELGSDVVSGLSHMVGFLGDRPFTSDAMFRWGLRGDGVCGLVSHDDGVLCVVFIFFGDGFIGLLIIDSDEELVVVAMEASDWFRYAPAMFSMDVVNSSMSLHIRRLIDENGSLCLMRSRGVRG